MNAIPHKTERLHSLDSLRAIMMLLGLVIHSATTYVVLDLGAEWPLKDPKTTHISNDFIVYVIHSFRMPIFFVVAGFFGALLFYERNPLRMIKNRISRVVFPFTIFLLILNPILIFSFTYTKSIFSGSEAAFKSTLSLFSDLMVFIPQITFHLWFLYYLALITFVAVGLGLLFKKSPYLSKLISLVFRWVLTKPIMRILIFAGITSIIYLVMGTFQVDTSTSLIPNVNTFIFYFFFYMTGWILFKSKDLLGEIMRLDWACILLGIVLLSIHSILLPSLTFAINIVATSAITWLLIFGITGLFIRYGSNHSSTMRYISDSSYWFYLVHLIFTAIIPSFIVDWPLPSTIKFLFVLISTSVICFTSYHYLVRATFIGEFLNGRRYTLKLSDIKQTKESIRIEPLKVNFETSGNSSNFETDVGTTDVYTGHNKHFR